ncbi:trace amine-associated receptor 13c-like [Pocillopora verrucosa]|uniref:trace amine-associated receptor 13c-like n=1 Tax=Pocillopora verrucosa TaxID=203993 RepID=UPI00333E9BBF
MNLSYPKEPRGNSSTLEIFCSSSPQFKFIWDSTQKTSLQLAIVVVTVACPFTVLLNIVVIATIKKVRQLQTNSNILIASLAVADLLVGAVCMPLTISLDTLILRGDVSENIICTRVLVATLVLYTAWSASFYHLVIISWVRYLAIVKRVEYKLIITKSRLKKYARIAWVTAFITTALFFASAVAGTRYEVLLFLDGIFGLGWLTGISIMVNFYRKLYLELRKLKRCQTSQVSVLVKARIERKIAHTTCLLTITVFIAIVPLMVVFITAPFLPFFRSYTVFRWAEIFLQINSLVNPVLYFHKNKRYRKFALQLFALTTTEKIESEVDIGRPATRHRGVEEPAEHKNALPSRRSLSCPEVIYRRENIRLKVSQVTPMERRMSLPSFQEDAQLHNALQPIPLTVTVQIKHTPRKKLVKRNSELLDDTGRRKRLLRNKNIRSTSLNLKIVSNVEIRAGGKRAKAYSQRRNSAP